MANKNFNTRIINKHDTEENWSKANFIPKQGELIIYDKDDNYDIERFKIGDGITTVNNLPFRSIDGGYIGFTEILSETTLNFTNSNSLTLTNCPPIEVGKEYIVTFYHPNSDNTEYKLVGKNASISLEYTCIGNETYTWGGGTDTTTPFLIFDPGSTPIIYISSTEALPCTYNIKIKTIALVKIDEKYLDIKNTNIVNGSAGGSIRTVDSAKESSGYKLGDYAFAEGYGTQASGYTSHAEGNTTKASGRSSHAEGDHTTASGIYSHAEGDGTTASGYASHAEGYHTTASGFSSHAEGDGTKALGNHSHAEGISTTASGSNSHAEGISTQASGDYSHVQGKNNIEDNNNEYADIIGNGSSDTKRSNAATVDWSGNAWYAGDVYVGSTSKTNKDEGSKKLATEDYVNSAISSSGGSGSNVQADWNQNDETANDYVKNRPGGYEETLENVLSETTFSDMHAILDMALVLGDTYNVTFDGVEYVSTAKQESTLPIFIGNTTYTWPWLSAITDEPFCIYYQDNACYINCDLGDHTIKIDKINIVKIDEKYLDIKNITNDEIDSICV